MIEELPTPIKSANDKKTYRVIRLPNNLTACLISDSSADALAAASLSVDVGSLSDPQEVPGLAHFLEHMVFMGSEKFPEENGFNAFITQSGGTDNATTDFETTIFHFECIEKYFFEGLDRWAQFFIAPLVKKEAITREREAVESEFQMALSNDSNRRDQILYSLSKVGSPVNSFLWGNLVTLKENISDEDLHEKVHAFRLRHYSSHRMTLAVQACLPLDTLQEYVVNCFSRVPNNYLLPDDFSLYTKDVFNTPEFRKIYYIKAVQNVRQLDLIWALPCLRLHYKTKPEDYLGSLLGDEGKGSILSYFRKKVWVLNTACGVSSGGCEHNSLYALFRVELYLTDEGVHKIYEIIETIYAYINLMKRVGPQERIFKELSEVASIRFRFDSELSAVDNVQIVSNAMKLFPSEDYLCGSRIFGHYDPEIIETVTKFLTPENMNVLILTHDIPEGLKLDKKEKWFGTEYTSQEIPSEWISKWTEVEPYPELNLPPPNPYLTSDFSSLPDREDNPEYPVKISNTNLYELWYRRDQIFKLPTVYFTIALISPLANNSVENSCMLPLLQHLIGVAINEELYPARQTDYSFDISSDPRGMIFEVSGYNEKLSVLIENLTKYIVTLNEHLTTSMFEAVKEAQRRYLYNCSINPAALAYDIRSKTLTDSHWTFVEKYTVLQKITFEMLTEYASEFFEKVYVKALVQGNAVSEQVALQTLQNFVATLKLKELPQELLPQFLVTKLPVGEHCYRVLNMNKSDANSITSNYYQANPFTLHEAVIIQIAIQVIEEPLFDTLRTKEQLGYSVQCAYEQFYGVLAYDVTVNSQVTKVSTEFVDERIEAFVEQIYILLDGMSEDEFEGYKNALIKLKQCPDVSLKEEVDRNWTEILMGHYSFDRLVKEVAEINLVQLDEVKNWWKDINLFDKCGKNCRKLSVQVVGFNIKEESTRLEEIVDNDELVLTVLELSEKGLQDNKEGTYFIHDTEEFKRSQCLYPVINFT